MIKKKTKKTNILDKAVSVESIPQNITALFYGRSGTGKTTLAGSFSSDVLLLDFKERGTDSVRDVPGVKVLFIDDWDSLQDVFWSLEAGDHDYQTVVLDTVSGMQDLAITDAKTKDGKSADSPTTQKMWGEVSGSMKEIIFQFRDLPINVVFLAHERVKESESEDELDEGRLDPEVGPNVIPSVSKTLCAAVKVIGNTYIKQSFKKIVGKPRETKRTVEYCLRVGPHPFYITKIRTSKLNKVPEYIPNATYEKIIDVISGNYITKRRQRSQKKSKEE